MARKKLGIVNFFVPAATSIIVFAAIISFNSKKITTYLLNNIEPYNIDKNIVGNLSNDSSVINTAKEDGIAYDGPYLVKRVIDGDTFIITMQDMDAKIRLIGVDTPESVAATGYDKGKHEKGKIASDYTKDLLIGREIYLEYDVSKTDKYGRLLAYVYYEEEGQRIMINQKLLFDGMAQLMTIQPNVEYVEEFTKAQESAREASIGFWKDKSFTDDEAK